MSDEMILTRAEARRIARLGKTAFDEALRRGDLPHVKIGRRVLIPRERFMKALAGDHATKADK